MLGLFQCILTLTESVQFKLINKLFNPDGIALVRFLLDDISFGNQNFELNFSFYLLVLDYFPPLFFDFFLEQFFLAFLSFDTALVGFIGFF